MTFIGFDADGVILDSLGPALTFAGKILDLLGVPADLSKQGDFERHFGAEALNRLVGHHRASALRMTHRLAMLRASSGLALFPETLAVVDRQPMPCIVITAAFAAGVRKALGPDAERFRAITGFETGRKAELLAAVTAEMAVYVTDSVSDLRICQRLDIPTIAVTCGYDRAEDLSAAGANAVATNAGELEAALAAYHPTPLQLTKEN